MTTTIEETADGYALAVKPAQLPDGAPCVWCSATLLSDARRAETLTATAATAHEALDDLRALCLDAAKDEFREEWERAADAVLRLHAHPAIGSLAELAQRDPIYRDGIEPKKARRARR
jgi:hypothetical protein